MKKKIKLAIIMQGHWSDLMGGAQYQVKCLIDELNKTGSYQIFHIARNYDKNYSPKNYQIIDLKQPEKSNKGVVKMCFDIFNVPKIIQALNPDIVYQRVACWQTGIAIYSASIFGAKTVWHISSDKDVSPEKYRSKKNLIFQYLDNKLIRYGAKNASFVIAQTYKQANYLEMNYGRKDCEVISNFHPVPKNEITKKGEYVDVLWISNIKRLKRPEIFIKLAEDCKNNEKIRFWIVGDLQGPETWRKMILYRISRSSNLKYVGRKEQVEVNKLLEISDILVNTSEWEGFPNTFIQAWMRKVPVISLSVDPDNILKNRRLGFCANSSYSTLLMDLIKLADNPELRNEIGNFAQSYAFKYHSLNNCLKLHDIFRKLY